MSDNDIRDIALAHMTIEQLGHKIVELERQLADIRFLIQDPRGWVIRTKKENQSLKQQLSNLTAKLSASQLEWKTGKPPDGKWCWMRHGASDNGIPYIMLVTSTSDEVTGNCSMDEMRWAGPIQPPEEKV
jgi:ribosomal protein L29